MNHSYIDKSDLVDRYLMGKLADDESADFEEHFLDCQRCTERLKMTQSFMHDLKHWSSDITIGEATPANKEIKSIPQYLPRTLLALAASILLVASISGVIMFRQIGSLQAQLDHEKNQSAELHKRVQETERSSSASKENSEETERQLSGRIKNLEAMLQKDQVDRVHAKSQDTQINVPFFLLNSATRGTHSSSESVNEVSIPRSAASFVVALGLEGDTSYDDYRVSILDAQGRQIFIKTGFKPDVNNSLSLRLTPDRFPPGTYTFRAEGRKSGKFSIIGSYPSRITRGAVK